jgi:hypothetical protein
MSARGFDVALLARLRVARAPATRVPERSALTAPA